MIGRTTLLWLALAALVGFGLFHVKYQVMALEESLSRLNTATLREQNQIHVLEAEWSYLNRPSRLEELSERYLELKPIAPSQLATVASLPKRKTDEEILADPSRIAKIMPPRKPPVPGRDVAPDARFANTPPDAPGTMAGPARAVQLPAPVTAAGLTVEGR
jgi:cell division protein FtsL